MTRRRRSHRSSERGFALAIAIIIAVLYFGLIELLMIDSSRELAQARQFRAKIVAQTLAENGAELAALQMTDPSVGLSNVNADDWQGRMLGTMQKTMGVMEGEGGSGEQVQLFTLTGTGEAAGVVKSRATVRVRGRIEGSRVLIDYTQHSQ